MASSPATCFHCGLPVPSGVDIEVSIAGKPQRMCCVGCSAISQAIVGAGLEGFYTHRTGYSRDNRDAGEIEQLDWQVYDHEAVQRDFVISTGPDSLEASLIIEGIVCAACVWLIERRLTALPGVLAAHVNLSSHRARIEWDRREVCLSTILRSLAVIGYRAHPFNPERLTNLQVRERAKALRRLAVAGVGAMQVMMLAVGLYAGDFYGMDEGSRDLLRWASMLVAVPVIAYSGGMFLKGAWSDFRRRRAGMDVPVSLAIFLGLAHSVWATVTGEGQIYFDSVTMFTFFLVTGRYLEMTVRHRAGEATEALAKLLPSMALKLEGESEQAVAVAELEPGDVIRVRPGERVPADAEVLEGTSSVDESLLTGESVPVPKSTGASIIGGSLNVDGPLTARVRAVGADTVLSSIQRLLDWAQHEKPAVATLADRVAGWFVLGVLFLAAVVAGYWWYRDPEAVLPIAISVLIVSCPCALSLATPTALTAATANLTRRGLLAVRGHALETLARVTEVVFDKTGTLTTGKLRIRRVDCHGSISAAESLRVAGALEQGSEHPVARAVCAACGPVPKASGLRNRPGEGVEGWVEGQRYRLGSARFVTEMTGISPHPGDKAGSMVYLGVEAGLVATIALGDRLRSDARQSVSELHRLGLRTVLLSGDGSAVTAAVAKEAEVGSAEGELLPEDKLQRIRDSQAGGAVIVAVGDGINDAPVLGGATVSVAMGGGTQLAQASADMVLLSERLSNLPKAIRLARKTLTVIKQNLTWAIVYNASALPLAAAGWVQPWMAAIGMSVSSLLVVLNALRLRGDYSGSQTVSFDGRNLVERALQ